MTDIKAGRLSADLLKDNFGDLHPPLDAHEASVEADRCYFCYDAPCMTACPTNIDVPLFIRQIATGNTMGSAETILQSNILGGMCARVCPTETLCEQACVREVSEGKPVKIGQLQRYATDYLFAHTEGHPFERAQPTGKRIAVVGAGPAGLSCAHRLAMYGHDVVIYEQREKPGGLSEYGIAAYKTTGNFAAEEVDFITGIGGIDIKRGQSLGKEFSLESLTGDYNAVFVGIGLPNVNELDIDGDDAEGCIDAVEYIAELRQADELSKMEVGRNVVVIGGGMTAIDIAVQSKLLGAENVTIAYRRGKENMNASAYEQELAQRKGVVIRHWLQPVSLEVRGGGVSSVTLEYTANIGGKMVGTGETMSLDADQVFKAIGQQPIAELFADSGVDLERGRIIVSAQRRTSHPKIWAGGDCVCGGEDLTVASVEDGKLAAEDIHNALRA